MFTINKDVNVLGVSPCMFWIALVVYDVFNEFNLPCHLSSGTEGKHMEYSHHYKGMALDFSLRDVDGMYHKRIYEAIKSRANNQFQVVLSKDKNGKPICIHVELDQK